jgi:hypothetical protein
MVLAIVLLLVFCVLVSWSYIIQHMISFTTWGHCFVFACALTLCGFLYFLFSNCSFSSHNFSFEIFILKISFKVFTFSNAPRQDTGFAWLLPCARPYFCNVIVLGTPTSPQYYLSHIIHNSKSRSDIEHVVIQIILPCGQIWCNLIKKLRYWNFSEMPRAKSWKCKEFQDNIA